MARKNRMSIDFIGFEEMATKLDGLGGDLKSISDKALRTTHDVITQKLHKDMERHKRTGKTENSIADTASVEWEGNKASIKVGFRISGGGLPSIFLMYGTPRMKKDQNLYNDVYGSKTRRQVRELQHNIFSEALSTVMEGG